MNRIMCLWFPHWPIQWRNVTRPADRGRTLVVHAPVGGKVRVIACCRQARRQGVTPGMLLAEAQSLWPASVSDAVRFEPHEPHTDRERLRELAMWCQQFSPSVMIDPAESPDCLLLDVTGCNERQLAEKATDGLQELGYWAVAAVADTVGAAWGVAHYYQSDSRIFLVPPEQHADALRPLPVAALRLSEPAVQLLHELNVHCIGELLKLPRAQLPSRFGDELLRAIDRALGIIPEALTPEQFAEPLEASWDFESPITDGQILAQTIELLLERLFKRIPQEHTGVRRLHCTLKPAGCPPVDFPIDLLQPSSSQRSLMELVRLQIERLQIPAEIEAVTVRLPVVAPLEFDQEEMFGRKVSGWKEVTGLIDRLSSRLGDKAVLRPELVADPQPEMAWRGGDWERSTEVQRRARSRQRRERSELPGTPSNMRSAPGAYATGLATGPRPVFLNDPRPIALVSMLPDGSPCRFQWQSRTYFVEHAWGPERIETGWWRGDDIRRDYYVVEITTGERFWLFRNLVDGSWFLHGEFA
jgi:protein ImuB